MKRFSPIQGNGGKARTRRAVACIEALEARWMLATTVLTTGTGPGSLEVTVDAYGAYGSNGAGDAFYHPVGFDNRAGTTYASGVYMDVLQGFLAEDGLRSDPLPPVDFISTSPTEAVSTFSIAGFDITLTQRVIDLEGNGAMLHQEYVITNSTQADHTLRLIRFVDGDLEHVGSQSDDRGAAAGPHALYEFDTTTTSDNAVSYFLISSMASTASGDLVTPNAFTIQPFPYDDEIVMEGGLMPHTVNQIEGDDNGDGITDSGYDVTLSQQVEVPIAAGETAVYSTFTIFSQGRVFDVIDSAPPPPNEEPTGQPITVGGDFDQTFGRGGAMTTNFTINGVVHQADGKVVAAGQRGSFDDFSARSILERYNPDGSLDTTFGVGGRVVNAFTAEDLTTPASVHYDVALAPDGKIVAVGEAVNDLYVARYNPDGSLDATFGNGGVVVLDLSSSDRALAVTVAPDGKILAAGQSGGDALIVRLNVDGSLDATFGDDATPGILKRNPGAFFGNGPEADDDAFGDIAIQPNGFIAAAGKSNGQFILCNFTPDGKLNPDWIPAAPFNGVWSPARAGFEILPTDHNVGIAVGADNSIVCVGATDTNDLAVWKLDANGNFDPSFQGNFGPGPLANKFAARDMGAVDDADEVLILPDGRILVVGTSTNGAVAVLTLAMFNPDGSVSSEFGQFGAMVIPQWIPLILEDNPIFGVRSQRVGDEEVQVISGINALRIGNLAARAFATQSETGEVLIGFAQQSATESSELRRLDPVTRQVNAPVSVGAFGATGGRRNTVLRNVTDNITGATFNVQLNGRGVGEVFQSDDGLIINISGANRGSRLVINTPRGGQAPIIHQINVQDNTLGGIQANNVNITGSISIPGDVQVIRVGNIQGARVGIGGQVVNFQAGDVSNSVISVFGSVNRLQLASLHSSQFFAGADLGDDMLPGGFFEDDDRYIGARINNARIVGAFNSSQLIVGVHTTDSIVPNVNDVFLSPSQIRNLRTGTMSADSLVIVQTLPRFVRVGSERIEVSTDGRFVTELSPL